MPCRILIQFYSKHFFFVWSVNNVLGILLCHIQIGNRNFFFWPSLKSVYIFFRRFFVCFNSSGVAATVMSLRIYCSWRKYHTRRRSRPYHRGFAGHTGDWVLIEIRTRADAAKEMCVEKINDDHHQKTYNNIFLHMGPHTHTHIRVRSSLCSFPSFFYVFFLYAWNRRG